MKELNRLERIVYFIDYIINKTENISFQEFINDEDLLFLSAFSLSQIGEITNKIIIENPSIIDEVKEIPWSKIRGMRNRIIHDYQNINQKILWETVTISLPELKLLFENHLKRMS
ncbi:MAG: DUF86 domain-containing protein [Tissierellia bacterium]|nr:DUF86 domain-containing protein [Tissierellia bacterium]